MNRAQARVKEPHYESENMRDDIDGGNVKSYPPRLTKMGTTTSEDSTCTNETDSYANEQQSSKPRMRKGSLQRQETCHGSSSDSNSLTDQKNVQTEDKNTEILNEQETIKVQTTRPLNQAKPCIESLCRATLRPIRTNDEQIHHEQKIIKATNGAHKVKVDKCTQVVHTEIKEQTGWKNLQKRQIKKYIHIENHCDDNLGKPKELDVQYKNIHGNSMAGVDTGTTENPSEKFLFGNSVSTTENNPNTNNEATVENRFGFSKNSETNVNGSSGEIRKSTLKPIRQSTVDTIDSGIVDELNSHPSGSPFRNTLKPRYILGHRVLSRRVNRRRVPIDPKFLCPSTSTSTEEERAGAKGLLVNSGQAKLSIAGLVQAVQKFTQNQTHAGRSKISSHKRRVMFSRRIILHRRSSSRGSSSRSLRSFETKQKVGKADEPDKAKELEKSVDLNCDDNQFLTLDESTSPSTDKEPTVRKSKQEQKDEDITKWVRESSFNLTSCIEDMNDDTVDINISLEPSEQDAVIDNKDTEGTMGKPVKDTDGGCSTEFLLPPSIDEADGDSVSRAGSTDDPNYCGFGVSPTVRRGLLDELDMFSNITSPKESQSRRDSVRDGANTFINQSWDSYLHPHINGLTVLADVDRPAAIEEGPLRSPTLRPQDEDSLQEIRSFLERALSPCPLDESYVQEEEEVVVSLDIPQTPNAQACKALGVALSEGTVATKNNFQVTTADAGNGTLTVGINGPRPHTVQETNVTYTGDNIYDVTYYVTQPGYYVITIKWSDVNIPGSPFICKVSY